MLKKKYLIWRKMFKVSMNMLIVEDFFDYGLEGLGYYAS
jgi:hypothetical protein